MSPPASPPCPRRRPTRHRCRAPQLGTGAAGPAEPSGACSSRCSWSWQAPAASNDASASLRPLAGYPGVRGDGAFVRGEAIVKFASRPSVTELSDHCGRRRRGLVRAAGGEERLRRRAEAGRDGPRGRRRAERALGCPLRRAELHLSRTSTPNDTELRESVGPEQHRPAAGTTADADIDAPEAWDLDHRQPGRRRRRRSTPASPTTIPTSPPTSGSTPTRSPATVSTTTATATSTTSAAGTSSRTTPTPLDFTATAPTSPGTIGAVGNNGIGVTGRQLGRRDHAGPRAGRVGRRQRTADSRRLLPTRARTAHTSSTTAGVARARASCCKMRSRRMQRGYSMSSLRATRRSDLDGADNDVPVRVRRAPTRPSGARQHRVRRLEQIPSIRSRASRNHGTRVRPPLRPGQ